MGSKAALAFEQPSLIGFVRDHRNDELLKAAVESSVSLKVTPHESDSVHCPFYTRHGAPAFQFYAANPEKAGRFARAMAGYRKSK